MLNNHIDVSYALHSIDEIIVIDHMDCGAYKHQLNRGSSTLLDGTTYSNYYPEIKAHVEQLNTFRTTINNKYVVTDPNTKTQKPKYTVKLLLMNLKGEVDVNPTYWQPDLVLNSLNLNDIVVIGDGTVSGTVKGRIEEPISTIPPKDREYKLYDSIKSLEEGKSVPTENSPYALKKQNDISYIEKIQNTSEKYYIRLEKSLAYITITTSSNANNADTKYSFTSNDYYKF